MSKAGTTTTGARLLRDTGQDARTGSVRSRGAARPTKPAVSSTASSAVTPSVADWPRVFRLLSATPMFRRFPRPQLLQLSRTVRCRQLEPGTVLIPEAIADPPPTGPEATRVFVVASGWCSATRSLPDGRRVIVGIRGVGQIAGVERVAFCLERMPSSVPATRRAWPPAELPGWTAAGWVSAVPVPVEELWAAMRLSPAVRDEADALAHERITELETALAERGLETADRLYRALRRMALRYGTATALGHALDLPLGQTELAAIVGTTRETVNRALRQLAAQGVVTLWEGRPLLIRTALAEWRRTG